jgi:hypothetical protein
VAIAVSLWLGPALGADAGQAQPQVLTLAQAVQEALVHNDRLIDEH